MSAEERDAWRRRIEEAKAQFCALTSKRKKITVIISEVYAYDLVL
jgi:hypothetical protein